MASSERTEPGAHSEVLGATGQLLCNREESVEVGVRVDEHHHRLLDFSGVAAYPTQCRCSTSTLCLASSTVWKLPFHESA